MKYLKHFFKHTLPWTIRGIMTVIFWGIIMPIVCVAGLIYGICLFCWVAFYEWVTEGEEWY